MSSILIKKVPEKFDPEMPKLILEALVGDSIGLCSPQRVIHVGGESKFEHGDIADFHNAYPVSFEHMHDHIRMHHPQLLSTFDEAYPNMAVIPNGTILLFHESCCEYQA